MIPKEIKYNMHNIDVRGDVLRRHNAQHQLQCKCSNIKIKRNAFGNKEHIK